jgi:hypothetical protein
MWPSTPARSKFSYSQRSRRDHPAADHGAGSRQQAQGLRAHQLPKVLTSSCPAATPGAGQQWSRRSRPWAVLPGSSRPTSPISTRSATWPPGPGTSMYWSTTPRSRSPAPPSSRTQLASTAAPTCAHRTSWSRSWPRKWSPARARQHRQRLHHCCQHRHARHGRLQFEQGCPSLPDPDVGGRVRRVWRPGQHRRPGPTRTDNTIERLGGALAAQVGATTLLGRLASTAEIAQVVLFLASDRFSYVTGATVAADAGRAAPARRFARVGAVGLSRPSARAERARRAPRKTAPTARLPGGRPRARMLLAVVSIAAQGDRRLRDRERRAAGLTARPAPVPERG